MFGVLINVGEDRLGIVAPFVEETAARMFARNSVRGIVVGLIRPIECVSADLLGEVLPESMSVPVTEFLRPRAALPSPSIVMTETRRLMMPQMMGQRFLTRT